MIKQVEKPYNCKVKTISRWIAIRFDRMDGNPYFIFHNRRISLDNVMRLTYPMFYREEDGEQAYISGYLPISNTYTQLVEVDPIGEYVRIWEEIDNV